MPHHQQQQSERDALDRGVLIKGTEEVPATAPIFEGHLYLQHPEKKNRWQWRLFRFDGTSFTCLSTRKIKLPKDTPVDSAIVRQETLSASRSIQQNLNSTQLNTSPSFNTSHTSPLLATPKDKTLRLISLANSMPDLHTIDKQQQQQQQQTTVSPNNNEETVVMASYYQLPKWTVDISNISAISVLKQQSTKKRSPFSTSSNGSKSKCFCVRTFDGECYIMKAQKHKDLERWLFVLTKMWRFAQTIRNQLIQQQQLMTTSSSSLLLHQQPQQQQHHHYPHQQQQQQQPLLAQSPQRSPSSYRLSSKQIWESPPENMHRPVVDVNNTMMMRNLVPPPPPFHQPLSPSNNNNNNNNNINNGSKPIPSSSPYDNRYKPPMLSTEKIHWIDQWRESLAELAAYDTLSPPPPIESIPDDDNMSSISGLTSISLREKSTAARKAQQGTPRRKKSKRSIRSAASASKPYNDSYDNNATTTSKSNSMAPADASSADILPQELPLDDRPSTSLKKKRSDDVKNWISNNTSNNNNPTSPVLVPTPDINFFQDARTILDGDGDQPNDKSIRYHSSIRGRNVRLVEEQQQQQQQNDNQEAALSPTKIISNRASIIADDQIYNVSPLQTLAKAESTDILRQHIDHAKRSSSPALLRHITNPEQQEDEDENMSLADLQRSLRRISMNEQSEQPLSHPSTSRARSPSASSILDRKISTLDQHQNFVQNSKPAQIHHQQHHYNYNHQHQHQMVFSSLNNTNDGANNNYPSPPPAFLHASPSSSFIMNNGATPPPIVAPAVPPMPVVGGGAPVILPHTPPHQAPQPRAYYAQAAVSSSELTSKSMHRYPDQSIERTHYHYNSHNMGYIKKRPKSWMLPSSASATSLVVEKQQQQQNNLSMQHSNNSTIAIEQYPTTRRSIDVMMDTQRSENNTRW